MQPEVILVFIVLCLSYNFQTNQNHYYKKKNNHISYNLVKLKLNDYSSLIGTSINAFKDFMTKNITLRLYHTPFYFFEFAKIRVGDPVTS